MYPMLIEKTFLKKNPKDEFDIYSFFINGTRSYLHVNNTASDILELCTGEYSLEDIIINLRQKYNEDFNKIKEYVLSFLNPFLELKTIIDGQNKIFNKTFNKGSKEIYYPSVLCWEITDYCLLNCKHCYLPKKIHPLIV